jgi:four helix bundle protein
MNSGSRPLPECRSEKSECRSLDRTIRVGNDLKARTKRFALCILKLYRSLPKNEEGRILGRQILRSGTSVGANYWAACRGRSRSEFIAKMGIVLEEADETVFWLELIADTGLIPKEKLAGLLKEADELTSIFVASLRTAKGIQSGT